MRTDRLFGGHQRVMPDPSGHQHVVRRFVVPLLLALLTIHKDPAVAKHPDMEAASIAFKARVERIQREGLVIRFSSENVRPPHPLFKGPQKRPDGSVVVPVSGTLHSRNEVSVLEGRSRFQKAFSEDSIEAVRDNHGISLTRLELRTFTREKAQNLVLHGNADHHLGSILDRADLPPSTVDLALGLRMLETNEWMDAASIDAMQFEVADEGKIKAVLHEAGRRRTHTWLLDPAEEFAPVTYTVATPAGLVFEEVMASDFIASDGLKLPKKILHRQISWIDKNNPKVIQSFSLAELEYKINDPINTPGYYEIVWPKGTRVLDSRIGVSFLVESGNRTLPDEAIFQASIQTLGTDEAVASGTPTAQEKESLASGSATSNSGPTRPFPTKSPMSQLVIGIGCLGLLAALLAFALRARRRPQVPPNMSGI